MDTPPSPAASLLGLLLRTSPAILGARRRTGRGTRPARRERRALDRLATARGDAAERVLSLEGAIEQAEHAVVLARDVVDEVTEGQIEALLDRARAEARRVAVAYADASTDDAGPAADPVVIAAAAERYAAVSAAADLASRSAEAVRSAAEERTAPCRTTEPLPGTDRVGGLLDWDAREAREAERALRQAERTLEEARDVISRHRMQVGRDPRRRLKAAERALAEARAVEDPAVQAAKAEAARGRARDALWSAKRAVDQQRASRTQRPPKHQLPPPAAEAPQQPYFDYDAFMDAHGD
jgi:hypothetical protein